MADDSKVESSTIFDRVVVFEDFDGDRKLDFATVGYRTPACFLADKPKIIVFLTRNEQAEIPFPNLYIHRDR